MDYHISDAEMITFGLVALWDLAWRGIALWQSSQRQQKAWFVVLLVINSAGLLPIAYLILQKTRGQQSKSEGNA